MTVTPPPSSPDPRPPETAFPNLPGAGEPPDGWRRSVEERLFEQRTVFLWGRLTDACAGRLATELMTLDATGDEPVHLHVDCSGGTLEAAFCLIDVIDLLGVDVVATCVGQAVGPALGPLAVAHRRRATPHARFRLTEPVISAEGRAAELASWAASQQAQFDRFRHRLAEAVGQPVEAVAADLAAGRFLDADGAVRYGLVDEICRPGARVYRLPGAPLGFRPLG